MSDIKDNTQTVPKKAIITLAEILAQSDDKTQVNRATRITKSAKMDYQAILDERTKEIFGMEDELEAMSDLSASNSMLSRNAVEPTKFDSAKYVSRRCELLIQIDVAKAELECIKEDEGFYA
jgi:hypothetical protein